MTTPNKKNKQSDSTKKDEQDNNQPLPPGSPDRTPIENPEEEVPMGDPLPQKDKAPRMG